MDRERFDILLNLHFDQLLSVEERKELEQMLLESSEVRRIFWEGAQINAAMRQWGQEQWGMREAQASPLRVISQPAPQVPPLPSRPAPAGSSASLWWPLAVAAMLVSALAAGFVLPSRLLPARSVAVLTSAPRAVWVGEGDRPKVGDIMPAGWLRLTDGFAQVEFLRGARVVIEGPAEFRLVSDNAAELRQGRLTAVVTQSAHGFQLTGGEMSVVDYGTAFGCLVPLAGGPELHVFSGEVGVKPIGQTTAEIVLKKEKAVRLDADRLTPIPVDPDAFIDEDELARLESGFRNRLAEWEQFSRQFRQQSGLVAYFDFQPVRQGERSLPNLASGASADADIIGAAWSDGRWSGKKALEFSGPNDRLRLSLPGQFESLTFFAWVRMEKTPGWINGLAMGETGDSLGEVQWYIYSNGALGAGVRVQPRGSADQWWHPHSGPVFKGSTLGQWIFVATVLDRANGIAAHYVDGELVHSDPMNLEPLFQFGMMEIGNWGSSTGPSNFQGRIDELAILSSALEAGEIRQIFERGRPAD